MTNESGPDLEARLAALEARVAQLEAHPAAPVITPLMKVPVATTSHEARLPTPAHASTDSWESWLGRAGVALLVFSFVLLYRYAVQRGWLTPELRVATGLITGAALVAAGHARTFAERARYRQILMGGGIVILFITGLAASQLYHLISNDVALVYFALAGALAFTLAARQSESVIATVGAVGALVSPSFLLTMTSPGLAFWYYLLAIVLWVGVLSAARGWEVTLGLSALASICAMLRHADATHSMQVAAVLVITAAWICFAALPLLLHTTLSRNVRLLLPVLVTAGLGFIADTFVLPHRHAFELSASIDAVGFAIIAWRLHGSDWQDAFEAAVFSCAGALAVASLTYFHGAWPFAALALIGATCLLACAELNAPALRNLAHALFVVVAIAFLGDVGRMQRLPAFDAHANAFIVATIAGAVAALRVQTRDERWIYWIGVYVLAHTLLATELGALKAAPWLATASYGVIGSALLLGGLAKRRVHVQRAGLLSLGLLVARLFLHDLVYVDVGVRIVLFMVCGVVFLGLSYLVRSRRFA